MLEMKDYFAIDLDPKELMTKVENYYNELESLGYLEKITRSYQQYYGHGLMGVSSKTTPAGKRGEITATSVNSFRSFLRHQFTLITSDRPAFEARPKNTDYKSQTQAMLGNDVLEHYMTHKRVEDVLKEAMEKSLYSSEGFVGISWDHNAGEPYWGQVDENDEVTMTGDIKYNTYSTLECIRDIRKEGTLDWVILVDYENRYEMAARYPELEREILAINTVNDYNKSFVSLLRGDVTDIIPVYRFYHRKGKILPEGKYGVFIDGHILEEGPLPFKKIKEIPVFRVTPAKLLGSALGYTQAFDLLGLQEVSDELWNAVISNNVTFSRQVIQGPKDADINHYMLADGLAYIEYDGDKPLQPLNFVNSAPETYNLIDKLDNRMEKFTGINDVVRGDPSANLRSGNSMALVAAQAIKFNSSLQNSYYRLIEDVGTATIEFLQEFADAPQFITVVGKAQKGYLKEFKSTDLESISRVEVQAASALSKTTAGRLEIANNLLQQGLIKRPEQYIAVLETGKLEPLIESEQSELLNIRAENERLRVGKEAFALAIDDHALHIKEHKAVINDPDARDDDAAVSATLTHISEHIVLWGQQSPEMLMALGMQPLPKPAMAPNVSGEAPSTAAVMEPASEEEPTNLPSLPELPDTAAPEDQAALAAMNLQQP